MQTFARRRNGFRHFGEVNYSYLRRMVHCATLNSSGEFLASYHVLHGIQKGVVKTCGNRNVLGGQEFAKFYCKIKVVRICYITVSNFELYSWKLRSGKVQLVVWYPVLINDWHDIFIMINSHPYCMLWINSLQDPSHVIWYLLGIVGFYHHWVGKAVRVTFWSWPGVESWGVDSIQCLK